METMSSGNPDFSQIELFENPDNRRVSYELLVGHERTDGSYKSSQQLHTEYVRLTDDIVHAVVDGVRVINPETNQTEIRPVDYVVWLDKSARPISWLMKELWPTLAKDKDGNVPQMPQSKFVNIDRNQWTQEVDPEGTGRVEVDQLDKSIIRSLRSIFLADPNDRSNGLVESIDEAPSLFDGKTVLIVDEVRSSGRTLRYAENFFKRAFPKASIAGRYWMSEMSTRNGAVGNADIPVWYSDETALGRGIGNRNIDLSSKSKNRTQKLGAWFLSSRLRGVDKKANQLRIEIHQLADDIKTGKVLVEPSRDRDEQDYDERALRLNGFDNFSEFLRELRALKEDK